MAPSSSSGAATGRNLFGRRRRPEGTRRRQLEWITNFALVVVSLLGISVGAGLIVFYKMDHFGFISWQFTYIPWILLGMTIQSTRADQIASSL